MSRIRVFVLYWLPVLVWSWLIFSASGDSKSGHHSSRIIGPIVRWLFPQMPEETVNAIVFAVRKCAHLVEYAVLAMLFWRAVRKPARNDPRPWSWAVGLAAILFVALYAATDEIHQTFVPSREGKVADVILDTLGGGFGILFLWALNRWRKRTARNGNGSDENSAPSARPGSDAMEAN